MKKVPPHGLNHARGGKMLLHQHRSNLSKRVNQTNSRIKSRITMFNGLDDVSWIFW